MKRLKLKTGAGDTFSEVSKKAKEVAQHADIVEFEFNGVVCLVNKDTNLDWLNRDYMNSWTMEWKEVGPDCDEIYSTDVAKELERREVLAEEKAEKERKEHKKKEDRERAEFKKKVAGLEVEFKKKPDWETGKANNTDSYGGCIYEYAEGWAKLMQREILNGNKLEDIAEKTSHELSFLGITGFMYGAAVSILSNCWIYGERLRKWHNKEYNHEGDGVVNPAIMTISTPTP